MIKYGFNSPQNYWIRIGVVSRFGLGLAGYACFNQAKRFSKTLGFVGNKAVKDRGVCLEGTIIWYGIIQVAFKGIGRCYHLVTDTNIVGVFDYCKYLYE